MPASNPSPPADANGNTGVRGLVNGIAQAFAGAKTFLGLIIASAGIQVGSLFNTNGTGASDVGVKLGVSPADGTVNAAAKIVSGRTGIGGTEVEKFYFRKAGSLLLGTDTANPIGIGSATDLANVADGVKFSSALAVLGFFSSNNATYLGLNLGTGVAQATGSMGIAGTLGVGSMTPTSAGLQLSGNLSSAQIAGVNKPLFLYAAGGSGVAETIRLSSQRGDAGLKCATIGTESASPSNDAVLAQFAKSIGTAANDAANGTALARVMASGRFDQSGTDSTGSPGNATIDKPSGKSAIAVGAASVVITNSLVTAASRVHITPHARDATCKELIAVPAAGSFTVSGTANATAALPFSWEVSNVI